MLRSALRILLILSAVLLHLGDASATRPTAPDRHPIVPGPSTHFADPDLQRAPLVDLPVLSPEEAERYVEKAVGKSAPTGGGADVHLAPADGNSYTSHVAIASDGDIFVALPVTSGTDSWLEVWLSRDGGDEFFEIWTLGKEDGIGQSLQALEIAEGTSNSMFLVYLESSVIKMATFAVAPTNTIPTLSTPHTPVGSWLSDVDLASDALIFSAYYLYMTWVGDDTNGDDIWFMRSVDQGATWESPYKIAELTTSGYLVYRWPRIVYGFGGYVHVAWTYMENIQDTFDDAILYQRATSYADGGISAWASSPIEVTAIDDLLNPRMVDIAASTIDGDVLIVYQYAVNEPDLIVRHSADSGASWPALQEAASGLELGGEMLYRAATDEFVLSGARFSDFNPTSWHDRGFKISPGSNPLSFGSMEILSDASEKTFISFWVYPALNPARGNRVALSWNHSDSGVSALHTGFDAEWRADTGYPNTEWIFDLSDVDPFGRHSPPAAVNVDADPYDEIVFGDTDGKVHVLSHTGVEVGGWPQDVGEIPVGSAVAIGDLNGDGSPEIVVGNDAGEVHAFHPDGSPLAGFPVDIGTGAESYVSIGALGGPYPRSIVVTSGKTMRVLDYHGVTSAGVVWLFTDTFYAPAAIGDVDLDGITDIVSVKGSYIHKHHRGSTTHNGFRFLSGQSLFEQPSLGDLDNDGDLEIVVPTAQGEVHVFEADLTDRAGTWPYSNPGAGYVNTVALANMLGSTSDVEIAFTQQYQLINVLYEDGDQGLNYPVGTTGGYDIFSGPAIERVNRTSPNVLVTTDEGALYSVENLGALAPDFPKNLMNQTEVTPVVRDIDLDGELEIVVLTNFSVMSIDINQTPHPSANSKWPMYGFDPQRTGCLDCPEDVATAAVDPLVSLISFAPPAPNPSSGSLVFHYVLPERATVELEVFDVRGRRLATVLRAEQEPGEHQISFDGRDGRGRELANGQYFGRLRVRGPRIDDQRTRKFTLVK